MLAGSRHLVDPCGVFAMVLVRKTTYLRYPVAIHPAHCKPCAVRCVSSKRKSEGTSVMPASPAARDISPTKGPPAPVSSATLPSKPDKEVSCLFILSGIVAEEHWSAQICKNIRLNRGFFCDGIESLCKRCLFCICTILCRPYPLRVSGVEPEPLVCFCIIFNFTNYSTSQSPPT